MTTNTVWFKLTIEVPAESLATVIQVLNAEGRNLSVHQMQAEKPHSKPDRTRHVAKAGEKTPTDIVLDEFAKHSERTVSQLGAVLAAKGYAAKSASPILSKLAAKGTVRAVRKGVYRNGGLL